MNQENLREKELKIHEFTPENTQAIGRPAKAFVDGVEVEHAIYANTKTGIVKHHTGKVVDGTIETITLEGKVTVEYI